MTNTTVHRVLIDNRSSVDIHFASAFDKMGIGREKLEPVNTHLRGFSGEKVLPLGSIQLVLTLGEPPCQATTTARFLIVDAPSAYNMLLGRPSLNAIKAIPSAYHMIIKFPTIHGVGMVRGDQRVARECYTASMKQRAIDNVNVDKLDICDEVLTQPEPSKELQPVSLDDNPEHLVRDKERFQHPVYYCSRSLRGAEERYPRVVKLILALVTATRKLRQYFQAHTIEVPTEYPMKQVLHKPETSGKLMKWAIELNEFDIRYRPKTPINGQVLADFVMEFASAEPARDAQAATDLSTSKLSVDGASNVQGSGTGLILTSP